MRNQRYGGKSIATESQRESCNLRYCGRGAFRHCEPGQFRHCEQSTFRHCERSAAISWNHSVGGQEIASSDVVLLAMTGNGRHRGHRAFHHCERGAGNPLAPPSYLRAPLCPLWFNHEFRKSVSTWIHRMNRIRKESQNAFHPVHPVHPCPNSSAFCKSKHEAGETPALRIAGVSPALLPVLVVQQNPTFPVPHPITQKDDEP